MVTTLKKPADVCLDQYRGSTILLKISGKQLLQKEIAQLVDDVQRLTRAGIRFLIVFGGGEQINKRWAEHHGDRKRPKAENGEAITTPEILGYARDAYDEICSEVRRRMPEVLILDPVNVHCVLKDGLQLTGEIVSIDLPETDGNVAIGFIGSVDEIVTSGNAIWEANVNADGICRHLVEQESIRRKIREVIIVTETKGVLDADGNLVPVLTVEDVRLILGNKGKHPTKNIEVKDGMVKKLQECLLIALAKGKAVMTDVGGVAAEIENYKGSGTLIFDPEQCSLEPMAEEQRPIFREIYRKNTESGTFRPRTEEELHLLEKHHRLFAINGSVLGGLSLVPHGDWTELETLWAEPIKNGLGQIVLNEAAKQAQGSKLYALASKPESIGALKANANFKELGELEALKEDCPPDYPLHLRSYDTSRRTPRVFVLKSDGAVDS